MKDKLGNELSVGDAIVYNGFNQLEVNNIHAITEKSVVILQSANKKKYISPSLCVKIVSDFQHKLQYAISINNLKE